MSKQQGSTGILILLVGVLVIVTLGLYIHTTNKSKEILDELKVVASEKAPEEIAQNYTNDSLGFSFEFDKEFYVYKDSEEEFNQRAAGINSKSPTGDSRKNFGNYVGYPLEKFLGAVAVLDETKSFEKSPLSVWIFENPNNLSPENWYKRYWYYPFIWGDFTSRSNEVAPTKEATISGQMAKYSLVDYQPSSPKFVYLSKGNKMFLFRVIGETGDKVLSTFKFLL